MIAQRHCIEDLTHNCDIFGTKNHEWYFKNPQSRVTHRRKIFNFFEPPQQRILQDIHGLFQIEENDIFAKKPNITDEELTSLLGAIHLQQHFNFTKNDARSTILRHQSEFLEDGILEPASDSDSQDLDQESEEEGDDREEDAPPPYSYDDARRAPPTLEDTSGVGPSVAATDDRPAQPPTYDEQITTTTTSTSAPTTAPETLPEQSARQVDNKRSKTCTIS